jgi:hypothetical protein
MMFQELRTGRPGEDGLPELDVDVGDLKFLKKSLATDGRNPGVLARKRLGLHPDPKNNGTGDLSEVGGDSETDNIDTRPQDPNGI